MNDDITEEDIKAFLEKYLNFQKRRYTDHLSKLKENLKPNTLSIKNNIRHNFIVFLAMLGLYKDRRLRNVSLGKKIYIMRLNTFDIITSLYSILKDSFNLVMSALVARLFLLSMIVTGILTFIGLFTVGTFCSIAFEDTTNDLKYTQLIRKMVKNLASKTFNIGLNIYQSLDSFKDMFDESLSAFRGSSHNKLANISQLLISAILLPIISGAMLTVFCVASFVRIVGELCGWSCGILIDFIRTRSTFQSMSNYITTRPAYMTLASFITSSSAYEKMNTVYEKYKGTTETADDSRCNYIIMNQGLNFLARMYGLAPTKKKPEAETGNFSNTVSAYN